MIVAELMPMVSYNKRGFANIYFNIQKIAATGNKTFIFGDAGNIGNTNVSFMQIKRALSSMNFNKDGFITFDVFYTKKIQKLELEFSLMA